MKCRIASSFGYQSIEPVKTSVAGVSAAPFGREVVGVDAGGDRAHRGAAARAAASSCAIGVRDGDGQPARVDRPAPRSGASCATRARAAGRRHGRRSTSREPLPDHVLDVVLEQHDRHARPPAARSAPRPGSRRRTGRPPAAARRLRPRAGGPGTRALPEVDRVAATATSARARRRSAALPCLGSAMREPRRRARSRGSAGRERRRRRRRARASSARVTAMVPRQLGEDVEAAQPAARVERPEPADLHPEDAHARSGRCMQRRPASSPSTKTRCQISRLSEEPEPIAVVGGAGAVLVGEAPRARPGRRARGASARGPSTSSSTSGQNAPAQPARRRAPGSPSCGACRIARGTRSASAARSTALVASPRSLSAAGHPRHVLDQLVIEKRARGSRSTRPCSSGPASSAARPGRSGDRRGSSGRACRRGASS